MSDAKPKNPKILLVDDFEIFRVMLRGALADLGYTNVEEAEEGKTAMAMLAEAHTAGNPFSLVFCDWNMPGMTGIEVLEACRSSLEFSKLPFIIVTAEAEQESVIRIIRAGGTDYLTKPISQDTLKRKVDKILSKQ